MFTLGLSFFCIALLYASVGFGGGSSYIALLAVAGIPYTSVPKISLLCNLIVVLNGTILYLRKNLVRWKLAAPLLITSVPFAFLGGYYPIQEHAFLILLSSSLFLAGIRILFIQPPEADHFHQPKNGALALTGAALGGLSGMVGIGGGIFLSPVMLNLRWAKAKEVAAIASLFILLNSVGGLIGQVLKNSSLPEFGSYVWLFLAVLAGGQIGSRIGTHDQVKHLWVQRATGILILLVSGRIALKLLLPQ